MTSTASSSSTEISPLTIVTELSVANVKFGGNALGGQYFFSFDNRSITVAGPPGKGVPLRFKLSDETAQNFVVTGLVSSDSQGNLSPPSIYLPPDLGARQIETVNLAITSCIFNIGILVTDLNNGNVVVCDPQVTNGPEEGPTTGSGGH